MDTTTENSQSVPNQFYGILFVVLATFAFSSKAIWIKLIYRQAGDIDAISIMTLRMAFAVPVYLVVAMFLFSRRPTRMSAGGTGSVLLLSFLGYYMASFLDISGLAYIPAALERMILYVYPTMVVLMVARQEQRSVSRREMVSLAISYIGIGLVFADGLNMKATHVALGSLLVLGAALSFSVFSVRSVSCIRKMGSMRFTVTTMLTGASMTLCHFAIRHGLSFPSYDHQVYMLAATLALVSTVIPSFLMAEGIRRIGADRTVLIGPIGPLATIVLGLVVLAEPVSTTQIVGSGVIIVGVFNLARTGKGS